jgi:hypothetical protein
MGYILFMLCFCRFVKFCSRLCFASFVPPGLHLLLQGSGSSLCSGSDRYGT